MKPETQRKWRNRVAAVGTIGGVLINLLEVFAFVDWTPDQVAVINLAIIGLAGGFVTLATGERFLPAGE